MNLDLVGPITQAAMMGRGRARLPPSEGMGTTLAWRDGEEATCAAALRRLLEQKGMTQEKLAEKVGIGQLAISMRLQRKCRPQKRTNARLADALEVSVEELWPIAKGKQ